MDLVPVVVGGAVGLTDGILGQTSFGSKPHVRSVFRAGVFLGGLVSEMAGFLSEDLSYGLMTSGITLLGTRIPAGFVGGMSSAFPYTAGRGGAAAPAASGCVSCGQHALISPAAPMTRLGSGRSQRTGRVA